MISFDWALKRLLRNKANFEVLEGFLSELLRRQIIIKSIAESEGNKSREDEKTNRVDMLVEADGREMVIVELQYFGEDGYFHRILYGASKAVTDYLSMGEGYENVRKVYSVSIVYFDLGAGDDYVYHGFTEFKGLHTQTPLQLNAKQQLLYEKTFPGDLYPEYYLIKLGKFNDVARNTLDEWIYYLKNNKIRDDFTAQGIGKAREILAYDNLSDQDKERYRRELDARYFNDAYVRTSYTDGMFKGKAIGLEEGEAIGLEKGEAIGAKKKLMEVVLHASQAGHPAEAIASFTGLTVVEINTILGNQQGTC